MSGIFITIEGPDGAGKTSVINELYPRLQMIAKKGIIKTREPGGVKISEKIRQIILDPRNKEMDERTEALLYAAARRQHLVEVILPALNEGKIVICDRFVDSSLAYQGAGRRIGLSEIEKINEFATEGTQPTFTLYLDVDSDTGLRRIQQNRMHQISVWVNQTQVRCNVQFKCLFCRTNLCIRFQQWVSIWEFSQHFFTCITIRLNFTACCFTW